MTEALDRTLFAAMLREEWRLHSQLFGGRRFAAFPLFVVVVAAATVWALTATGTDVGAVVAGLHALVFAFGLQTGTVGFLGRDAMRNLIGDITLVVFSARTLPLSERRLLVVFVVKDVVYYSGLFLLPLTAALVPAAVVGPAALSMGTVALIGLALVWTFLLGVAVTFAAIALTARGIVGRGALLALAAGVGVALAAGVDVVALTPYGLLGDRPLVAGAASLALTGGLLVVGVGLFDTSAERPARTAGRAFRRWHRRLPVDETGLTTKSLRDVARSSGGYGKVVFSAAVLFAVTAFLVDLVETVTGVAPSVPVAFGAVLGLTAFTTYNWLTQFDDVTSYRIYPLSVADVYRGKFRAFLLVGPPTALAFYALAVGWRGGRPLAMLAGAAVLVGVQSYAFGLTVYLAGDSPNEFLFDTVLFAAFGAAVAVPLVPVLVVAFALAPVTAVTSGALVVGGVLAAVVGLALYRRSLSKWERYHRQGA